MPEKGELEPAFRTNLYLYFLLALAQAVILVSEPQCVWIYSVIFAWGENPLFNVLL